MAHRKAGGSTSLGRDSQSKRLGVKLFGGELAKSGNIIIRQRGTKYHPGENVGMGKDYTIFALIPGTVKFQKKKKRKFTDKLKNATIVNIIPEKTATTKTQKEAKTQKSSVSLRQTK